MTKKYCKMKYLPKFATVLRIVDDSSLPTHFLVIPHFGVFFCFDQFCSGKCGYFWLMLSEIFWEIQKNILKIPKNTYVWETDKAGVTLMFLWCVAVAFLSLFDGRGIFWNVFFFYSWGKYFDKFKKRTILNISKNWHTLGTQIRLLRL